MQLHEILGWKRIPAPSFALTLGCLLAMALFGACSRETDPIGLPVEELGLQTETPQTPSSLGIGDPAPKLSIDQWVVGSPVKTELSGRVHVVEFWATWCGPCRMGMPHLSELQQQYGEDVAFIGVTREDTDTVNEFLASKSPDGRTWDEVIQYRLATDSGGRTNQSYMAAAGQRGIPAAFIVGRDSVVQWIGHPARIDQPLQQVVDGTWDIAAAAAQFQAERRLEQASAELEKCVKSKDWDRALALVDQLQQETGQSAGLSWTEMRLLDLAGKQEEAASVRAELVEQAWEDPSILNAVAWTIATSGKEAELELALRASKRASELSDDDPQVLDTVARVQHALGQLDEAIAWQRRAVEKGQGQRGFDETLEAYLAERAELGEKELGEQESGEKAAGAES